MSPDSTNFQPVFPSAEIPESGTAGNSTTSVRLATKRLPSASSVSAPGPLNTPIVVMVPSAETFTTRSFPPATKTSPAEFTATPTGQFHPDPIVVLVPSRLIFETVLVLVSVT